MSIRTLQRVLAVCSSSVRKSLQGLDNFSVQGAEAFDLLRLVFTSDGVVVAVVIRTLSDTI